VLRDEDREILANCWLSEFLFAAYNTPREQRRPFAVFIDGTAAVSSLRAPDRHEHHAGEKIPAAFLLRPAGTQFFEGGIQNPLLNGLTSACRVHLIFRHQNEVDATYFGKLVKLPELSSHRVKHEQRVPMQFQDGHDLVTLVDESDSWQDGEQQGGSEADGTTDSTTRTSGTNEGSTETRGTKRDEHSLRRTVNEAKAAATGSSESSAQANGSTHTTSTNWARTSSRGGSKTYKQSLVPRIVVRDIITSVQFFTTEEQLMEAASQIASAPTGTAFLYIGGRGTVKVCFPLPKKPFRLAPRFGHKKTESLWQLVTARPEYATAEDIAAQREAFTEHLAARLHGLAGNLECGGTPATRLLLSADLSMPQRTYLSRSEAA